MSIHDRVEIHRRAKELRREEISRLWDEAACAVSRVFARLARHPAPPCAPRKKALA